MGANKYELDKFFHPAPIPVVRIPEAMHSSRDGKKVAATLKMQQGRQLTMMPNKNVKKARAVINLFITVLNLTCRITLGSLRMDCGLG